MRGSTRMPSPRPRRATRNQYTPPLPLRPRSAWLVKTRRAPSRHSRDARVYGHTTTAMHVLNTTPAPVSGTSVGRSTRLIWSMSFSSGLSPPCIQNIFSSTMAATGKQLKQSVNVFQSLMLYRRLPARHGKDRQTDRQSPHTSMSPSGLNVHHHHHHHHC